MAANDNMFRGLVTPVTIPGVVAPGAPAPSGAPSTTETSALRAAEEARENRRIVAGLKVRFPASSEALESIAQDSANLKNLQELVNTGDDEAINIAIQALSLRAALNAAKQSTNTHAVKDIQGKLAVLHSRALALPNSNARDLAKKIVGSTQDYAESVAQIVSTAASEFLEAIGSVASAAVGMVKGLFDSGMSSSARSFLSTLNDNQQYSLAEVRPDGNIAPIAGESIRGDEIRRYFGHLHGDNAGMSNPLLKPGKLQILENDDVLGTGRSDADRLAVERVEVGFMRQSLNALERFKTAMLLEREEQMAAQQKVQNNRRLFQQAQDEMDAILRNREALTEPQSDEDREKIAEALKEAKVRLRTTLRRIADEVMGEAPATQISGGTSVDGPASGPATSTETSRRIDPSRGSSATV